MRALPVATFWRQAFTLRGSVSARVLSRTLAFGLAAVAVTALHERLPRIAFDPAPFASSGVVLGLLLVFRTNAGYDRWWEARVLWGGITNQSRNLVLSARAFAPEELAWRRAFGRWVAAFTHAARGSLREERSLPALAALLGPTDAAEVCAARHMPGHVAGRLAAMLHDAHLAGMNGFAFAQLDRERALLMDHIGGCERILTTPMPVVFTVMTRRFLTMYLLLLPFGLVGPLGWLTPALVLFVAYPILSLEQIGAELQNPFVQSSLSHLPLDALCASLADELLATTDAPLPLDPEAASGDGRRGRVP